MTASVDSRAEEREEVKEVLANQVVGDGPVANQVNIGLKTDQILQRYLVRRIHREAEFKFVETDGTEHLGFITGFDDKCLQFSTTPRSGADFPRSILIFWPMLRRIEETGDTVGKLESDHRIKIRSYSHALRAQCELTLAPKPKNPIRVEASSGPEFSE